GISSLIIKEKMGRRRSVVQAYAGHSRLETTETYTRVFALDVGRQYGVRFSLPDSHLTLPE
ncbi:hypothetical protein ELE42_28355, partial [Klebsiella pneumoniae]|nr:hypothetical protein [Klebsiella pneumoniae]